MKKEIGLGVALAVTLCFAVACSFFKQPGCFIQDQAVTFAVDAVASTLECGNRDAVRADLSEIIGRIGLCKAEYQTGQVADLVCPVVVGAVIQFVQDKAIPSAWQCTAGGAKAKLSEALLEQCKKIPVSQPAK